MITPTTMPNNESSEGDAAGVESAPTRESTLDAPPLLPVTESIDWLRFTLSSIGDGVIAADREGHVSFLNAVAEKMTGWAAQEAIGVELTKVFQIVDEDTKSTVENPALRSIRDAQIVGLANHTLLIHRDGTVRAIEDSASPIVSASGQVVGAVLIFRDITERKKSAIALRRSEMRYRRLFQTAKDGILILDANSGRITDANSFMCGLVGMGVHELIGKEVYEIGMAEDEADNKASFRELQAKQYIRHEHLPLRGRSGQPVAVEFIANVYLEGDSLVAQCNVRDIAERSRMEQQIAQQSTELAEQSRRKDEFLAMLSHELRNPLAPIRAALYLLKIQERGSANLIQQQAREIIERQVTNLTKLVNDLMEISRVVSGRIRLELQPLDLNQVVAHAVESTAPLFEHHRHARSVTLCTEPLWVHADATRLEEVFVNLLNNAAKYTPDSGHIEVNCQHQMTGERHEAVIQVRDNGMGIEHDLLPRIFDLFSQADRSLARSAGGLGIGLTLVHRLVEMHGGTVEASSQGPSEGSLFVVRLPLIAPPLLADHLDPATRPEAPAPGPAVRVLVVDDNIDFVKMIASVLHHRGYSVRRAHNGPEGLLMAQQWRPEVVVLDIGLPDMDGYEVARRLRAAPPGADEAGPGAGKSEPPRMRLIALTGYGREADVILAREAGFDNHLVKPCDIDELERMIAAVPRTNLGGQHEIIR